MNELQQEVGLKFTELLLQYCLTSWTGNFLVDMSFGYVRFAKDEKELFRIMFLTDELAELTGYQEQKPLVFEALLARLKEEPQFKDLADEQIHHITQNMEIIIHGLACLVNYGRLADESDEYILQYLKEVSSFFVQREEGQRSLVNQRSPVKKKGKEMSTDFAATKWYSYTSSTETMRTWVRQIDSYEEIPQEFQAVFPQYEGPFPYTLYIPEDKYTLFLQRNKKLLCMVDEHLVVLEIVRDTVEKFSSPITEVLYLELGRVLLNSWLTIHTLAGTVSITFNTVNDLLFEPVIEEIRRKMGNLHSAEAVSAGGEQELAKFNYLSTVNYKYMNYGRQSIRFGDTVAGIVYQPECCVQEYTLFNKTLFRRYATAHLSILTRQELILIKEIKQIKTAKEVLSGGIFTYIPRPRIQGISFKPNAENTQTTMEITLPDNVRFTSEFSLDNKELPAFQQKCRDIGL
jgi:hypothetical protein